jgi:hypothetical protein
MYLHDSCISSDIISFLIDQQHIADIDSSNVNGNGSSSNSELNNDSIGSYSNDMLTTREFSLSSLKVLDISWCEELTSVDICKIIHRCCNLTTLQMQATKADSSCLYACAESCLYLEVLNVSRCGDISSDSLIKLCQSKVKSTLQSINLSWSEIDDESVMQLCYICDKLKVIVLQGCKYLTSKILDDVLFDSKICRLLQFIDLSWVNMFSSDMAIQLSLNRKDALIVGKYGCY